MTSKKTFFLLIGVIVLLVAGSIALTYYGIQFLGKKGDTLVEQKLTQQVLSSRETALVQARKDIVTYKPLADIAKTIVPQDKDQARTVREIVSISESRGVPLASITFPESALGEVKKKAAAKKGQPTQSSEDSQLYSVEGTDGLYSMEITIVSSQDPIPYSRLLAFLEGLENNRRTAHVTSINIQPSEENGNLVTFTIKLNVYIKP